jgi:hypothetical protein
MPQITWTHQLLVFVPSAASEADKEEISSNFPYREADQLGIIRHQVLIHLTGNMNKEQVIWLTSQKDNGKISRWMVLPFTRM